MQMQFKLGNFKRDHYFAENYQPDNFQLAFAKVTDDSVVGLHPPVKCRDFLLDTLLWSSGAVPKDKIYGYDFAGPIDKDVCLLAFNVKHPDNMSEINTIELAFDLEPTTLSETTEKGTYLLQGSSFWQENTVKLSLYTFLVRAYLSRNVKDLLAEMQSLHALGATITSAGGAIQKIMTMKKTISPYILKQSPEMIDKRAVHDASGFANYLVFPNNYKE
jgi:hypothetical protein